MNYQPKPFATALNRVNDMPFAYSINPYRGCRHACLYCYAREYHRYIGYEDPADFDSHVLYKSDFAEVLARQLDHSKKPIVGEIAIGTGTDPYQPLEARERITRRVLEVLLARGLAVSITTKSPLVLRDLDLLKQFQAYGGVRVNITVTVLQPSLWRLLEPQTATPSSRLQTVHKLAEAGIACCVFLAPVIPGIGEGEAIRVLSACQEHGANHVMISLLRLSPGVAPWLLPRLRQALPTKASALERRYGAREALSAQDQWQILEPLKAVRAKLGLDLPLKPLRPKTRQLTLFS